MVLSHSGCISIFREADNLGRTQQTAHLPRWGSSPQRAAPPRPTGSATLTGLGFWKGAAAPRCGSCHSPLSLIWSAASHQRATGVPRAQDTSQHLTPSTCSTACAPLPDPTQPSITPIGAAAEPAIFYLLCERDPKSNCTFWRAHAVNYPRSVFYQDAIMLADNSSFLGCYSRDHKDPPSAAMSCNCLSPSGSTGNFSIIKTGLACIKKRSHQLSLWNQATPSDVRTDNGSTHKWQALFLYLSNKWLIQASIFSNKAI